MLVDDPVKRVDNMTMAWALEARVPFLDHEVVELAGRCPPELKLAARRQGRAQGGAPGRRAGRRHRPAEGLLPRARRPAPRRARSWTGCGTRSPHPPPGSAALFRPDVVAELLADPNSRRTTIGANVLWQVGLLELWLQRMGL